MADDYSGIARPVAATAPANPYEGIAKPQAPQATPQGPNPYEGIAKAAPTQPGGIFQVARGLQGAYKQSAMSGLMTQPIRAVMQASGYGRGELEKRYPNQTDEWYKRKLHEAYNEAIRLGRADADQQVADNPYPGDKVGNFAAGVVGSADPTLFIPGVGAGKLANKPGVVGAALRVGSRGASEAVYSSVGDAAAQGMDIATDTVKDFDIERNLKAAAFGAVLGSTISGVGEATPTVSKHVKELFKARGVDTLPSATPDIGRSPTTGNQPSMSPEQTAQLQQLVKTGSVDEIKAFFADKQGPKPTWREVNQLVETRDAAMDGGHDNLVQALDDHLESTHKQVVQDHIDEQMADWKNKPEVEVLDTIDDIADPAIRQNSQGLSHENTVGFVGPDGKVRIFAKAARTPGAVNSVLYHEALGHYGLAQKFGAGLDKRLDTLAARNVSQFGKAVDAWQKKHPTAYNGSRTRAAEEVFAEMSQNGQVPKSIADAMTSYVRDLGRKMGMDLHYSDAEVHNILSMAHDAVINGKGRDAGANGFKFQKRENESDPWMGSSKYDMTDEDVRATLEGYDEFAEPFEDSFTRGPKDLTDRDVGVMVNHDNVFGMNPRDPSPGDLSRQDLRTLQAADNGNRYMFTGKSAKNFDPNAASTVEASDGTQRNEISDKDAKVKFDDLEEGEFYSLDRVMDHPTLYDEYPALRDLKVYYAETPGGRDYGGIYHEAVVNPDTGYVERKGYIEMNPKAPNKKSTLIHEVQHAIQDIEQYPNFRESADIDQRTLTQEQYLNDPVEVEARTTEARAILDQDQINKFPPPKFMTPEQLREHAENTHQQAFDKFGEGYVPKYRSIKEAQQAARDTALSPSAIKDSRAVGNLDRKLFIYDNAAKEANAKLLELSKKAEAGELTGDDLADLAQTANDFNYVLGRLDNDLGQVGRALRAAKDITFRRNNILAMQKALDESDSVLGPLLDPENANKFLKQFAALQAQGNPKGAAALLQSVNKPYWWQYALSYRNNMMLSGLSTHLKVAMDTATNAGREVEEKLASLPAGALRDVARSMGLKNVQQGVHPTEVASHLWGMARAVLDAQTYKDAARAFSGQQQTRFGGTGIPNPRIPGVSKITDAIAAQDAFFRSVLENANLYALGAREARKSGLTKWDDITTAAEGHARQPSRRMLDEAKELAENTMLTNRSDLNDGMDKFKRIRPGMNPVEQFGSFLANYFTPFIRTQSNALMNQIIRRSPLSFLDPMTRADFAAGGARRDVAVMRTLIGTAIIVNAWNAADPDNKKLHGAGPTDKIDKLKELEASGWRPGSVEENGRFNQNSNLNISLNPFDLHNNTATLVAGIREAYEAGNDKDFALGLKLAFHSTMQALQSQTFVTDLGEAWEATSKKGETGLKKAERFLGNQAASFIPNVVRQTAKVVDPVARNTSDSITDQLQSNIPGMSQKLPAQVSVYGEDVKTGKTVAGVRNWLSEGPGQEKVTDPPMVELARLGDLFKQTIVPPVERTITVPDTSMFEPTQITDAGNVRLNARQFEEYQRVAGKEIVENMRDMMDDPSWAELTDEEKAVAVRKMQSKSKKAVREYLYGGEE